MESPVLSALGEIAGFTLDFKGFFPKHFGIKEEKYMLYSPIDILELERQCQIGQILTVIVGHPRKSTNATDDGNLVPHRRLHLVRLAAVNLG